jgi:predicted DNA binding CopG/RHH family protein
METVQRSESVKKERNLNIRVSDEDMSRLEALAEHYEMSQSQVLRMLVKRDAEATGVEAKKPTRRKTVRKR